MTVCYYECLTHSKDNRDSLGDDSRVHANWRLGGDGGETFALRSLSWQVGTDMNDVSQILSQMEARDLAAAES